MKYRITLEKKALEDIDYFYKNNKQIFDKIEHLLSDITNNPFAGIGKPERLRFEFSGCWSKRINKEHRMVYRVTGDLITVLGCRHHYN